MLERTKLFNPNGGDSFEEQALLGGNPSGIANLNNSRYSWVSPLYRQMVGNFWIPEKVDLTGDKVSIKELTEDEDEATKNTLSFLIFLDNYQTANLPNISGYITNPNVRNLLAVHAFQEVIHSAAYQYVLEALYPTMQRDEIYNRWKTNTSLMERNKSIAKIGEAFSQEASEENFHRVLAANFALEGIYFYQGFNFFDQLAHRNRLVQTDKEIDYIRNDELTHMGLFVNIMKEAKTPKRIIEEVVEDAVKNEIAWCKSVYGNRILGISESSSEEYVKYIANDRLGRMGIAPMFQGVRNPYAHIEQSKKSGGKRENFFESGAVTEYDTAGSVDGWDDL